MADDLRPIPLQTKDHKSKITDNKKPTDPYIWQEDCRVQIGFHLTAANQKQKTITIKCLSHECARRLALELAGVKVDSTNPRLIKFFKLASHPWYGKLILGDLDESLSSSDLKFIIFFIKQSEAFSEDGYRRRVHELFLDDPQRPRNHPTIQEVLSCL